MRVRSSDVVGRSCGPFEIEGPSRRCSALRERYAALPKLTSWLRLHEWAQPTLAGSVVATAEDAKKMAAALAGERFPYAMIRSDAAEDRIGARRDGGYLMHASGLAQECALFLNEGRVVFALEPIHRLEAHTSFALAVDWRRGDLWIDYVGPGFDTSDLKRGRDSGHVSERWSDLVAPRFKGRSRMGAEEYREAARRRAERLEGLCDRDVVRLQVLDPRYTSVLQRRYGQVVDELRGGVRPGEVRRLTRRSVGSIVLACSLLRGRPLREPGESVIWGTLIASGSLILWDAQHV